MNAWGRALFGDPCRECGYDWSTAYEENVALVGAVPGRYAALLDGRDAALRHPDLDWTAGAYVCHVTDNLRIWAERLMAAALGGGRDITGYDDGLLARARAYDRVPVAGALWSLRHAAAAWVEAVERAMDAGVVLRHPDRGEQRTPDVAATNAHDAYHHEWDIRRTLESAPS
ncbi:hypothetical protein GCM10029978_115760 [Actinoallomurus acanthiterrae]